MKSKVISGIAVLLLLGLLKVMTTAWQNSALVAPQASFLVYDRHGHFLAQVGQGKDDGYGYWPLDELPQRLSTATLALEDRRFWRHPGVDPLALGRAVWQNLKNRQRISGGSTIAMQVARMQNPKPRTYINKIMESASALLITLRHGRLEVLKHYLRLVPYGNRSHGIGHAARIYLEKPVEDLSWAEIAFLAAIPQSPSRMNPYSASGRQRARKRGLGLLNTMADQGLLNRAELELAKVQLARISVPWRAQRPLSMLHAIRKVEEIAGQGKGQGQRLFTTLDLELQERISDLAENNLDQWRSKGADNTAIVVVRPAAGEVLAWLGSTDYFSPDGGAIDYTGVDRSPGSTLKPFLFGLAMDRGLLKPNTVLDDLISVAGIENSDRRFLGPLLPRQALANSRNVPAVNLLKQIGLHETYQFFGRLGLHDNRLPADHYGLGLAIGGMPTKLEHLVRAYAMLANNGVLQDLRWFREEDAPPGKRVLSQAVSRHLGVFLSDPMARLPTFARMGATEYPMPVAVKTGTSQGFRDAWTLAYSREYLVGVWVGRADWSAMHGLSGGNSAAKLAKDILSDLHVRDGGGFTDLSLPIPQGYVAKDVCGYTGQLAVDGCFQKVREWFPAEDLPEEDNHHLSLPIDRRNGFLASSQTPSSFLEYRNFVRMPGIYATWAKAHGLSLPPDQFSTLDLPEGGRPELLASIGSADLLGNRQPATLSVLSPENGLALLMNPETPAELNSIALRVVIEPPVEQVLWYVDGQPYTLADAPYSTRWPLTKGRHSFQARLPYRDEVSDVVEVFVE